MNRAHRCPDHCSRPRRAVDKASRHLMQQCRAAGDEFLLQEMLCPHWTHSHTGQLWETMLKHSTARSVNLITELANPFDATSHVRTPDQPKSIHFRSISSSCSTQDAYKRLQRSTENYTKNQYFFDFIFLSTWLTSCSPESIKIHKILMPK